MPCEKDSEVGNSTMIDVGIGLWVTRIAWVGSPAFRDVVVNQGLQVNLGTPIGADNNVRANTFCFRDIAIGVADPHISWIIGRSPSELISGVCDRL